MHTLYIFSLLLSEIASLFFQNLYNVPPGCSIITAVGPLIRWRGGITAANNRGLYNQSQRLLASETFDWNNKQKKGLERGVAPIFCAVSLPNIGFNRKSTFTCALDDHAGVFSNVGGGRRPRTARRCQGKKTVE